VTLRVIFRRAAQAEFIDAAAWYDQRREGLGEEFVREIEIAIDKVAQSPASYPIVSGDVRRTVIRRFPYCIYFRIRQNQLVVLAVFHGRRDPEVWQRRT
jgi:plasmid stabilization system protein ParE